MLKLLVGALLTLTAANSVAGNITIYKDKGGKVLLTSVNPSDNFVKFTKKVKVTDYRDDKAIKSNQNQADSKEQNADSKKQNADSKKQNVSYGTDSNSVPYSNSAYKALR